MSIDNDLLHRGIENRHFPVYSSLYMSFILSLHILVRDISTTKEDRNFIFGIQNKSNKLYFGTENQLSFICAYLYLFTFLARLDEVQEELLY